MKSGIVIINLLIIIGLLITFSGVNKKSENLNNDFLPPSDSATSTRITPINVILH